MRRHAISKHRLPIASVGTYPSADGRLNLTRNVSISVRVLVPRLYAPAPNHGFRNMSVRMHNYTDLPTLIESASLPVVRQFAKRGVFKTAFKRHLLEEGLSARMNAPCLFERCRFGKCWELN